MDGNAGRRLELLVTLNPSYLTPDWGLVKLMVQMLWKIAEGTGLVLSIPCVYIAEAWRRALRVPAPQLSRDVVSIEKAKARKAVA